MTFVGYKLQYFVSYYYKLKFFSLVTVINFNTLSLLQVKILFVAITSCCTFWFYYKLQYFLFNQLIKFCSTSTYQK